MKFTEAQLEKAFISLLQEEKMTHLAGGEVRKTEFNRLAEPPTVYGHAVSEKVLIIEDLKKIFGQPIQVGKYHRKRNRFHHKGFRSFACF